MDFPGHFTASANGDGLKANEKRGEMNDKEVLYTYNYSNKKRQVICRRSSITSLSIWQGTHTAAAAVQPPCGGYDLFLLQSSFSIVIYTAISPLSHKETHLFTYEANRRHCYLPSPLPQTSIGLTLGFCSNVLISMSTDAESGVSRAIATWH